MSAFPECRHDVADRLEKHLVMAEREPGVVDALGVDQAEAESRNDRSRWWQC